MNSHVGLAVLLGLFGFASALKIQHYQGFDDHEHKHYTTPIPILKHEFEQSKEGYKYSYEGGNGIHAHETGYIKNHGDEKHSTLVQQGSISYHDEHGHPIVLTYIADEHGFRPQGDHLPTPPPLPLEHYKAIEEHNAHIAEQQGLGHQLGGGGGFEGGEDGGDELSEHYGHQY